MWSFRLTPDAPRQPLLHPSTWEEVGLPKNFCGPVWFHANFSLPQLAPNQRVWLHFHGVSYHCEIYVNEKWIGKHTGAWDSFTLEITPALNASAHLARFADILVQVTKPSSLTAGPDSVPEPGPYPLRETLSGFLPYVWGHAFGGIWQPVELYTTGPIYFEDAFIQANAEGRLKLQATLSAPSPLHLQILDPSGQPCLTATLPPAKTHNATYTIPNIVPWSPTAPALYTAHLTLPDRDHKNFSFGFRTVSKDGSILLLNGFPIYPRFILSWGWFPPRMCPDPGADHIRMLFTQLKTMGYNGVKLCLWFPPRYVFDLADEMGLLLWLEFPLWLPQVTEFFRAQTPIELERLARLARQHPSVILYTLGCELGPEVDTVFLETLIAHIKPLLGDALLTGNSGSGEAYGGPLQETADFYDHHFYTNPPFLPSLLDAFAPHWRAAKPWLMGEFCDFDTLRNWLALLETPERLWWLTDTPQGARWAMEVYEQQARLKALGLWEQMDELHQLSLQKALLHRKRTIETIRARPALSGYVITGEVDTPISTAGMWDDLGLPKFKPEDFRSFNAETVLLLGFRRWRKWEAGGDRPAYSDRFCVFGGEEVNIALLVSYFGLKRERGIYTWEIGTENELPFAQGEGDSEQEFLPGSVQQVGSIRFQVPEVSIPIGVDLRVAIEFGGERVTPGASHKIANKWRFWLFPREVWAGVEPFALVDPSGRLADLAQVYPTMCRERKRRGRVAVITQWSAQVARWVKAGGRAVVLQGREPGPLPVVARPFWRECIQIGMAHPAWGRFPFSSGEPFEALGTDLALATAHGQGVPLLQRLDTRQTVLEDYAVELAIGQGRIILTTLRLDGGLGDQPTGSTRSPAGLFLLAEWLRYLQAFQDALI